MPRRTMGRQTKPVTRTAPGEALDVHGLDLLSQVEAMLRHVREYQRDVQRYRGHIRDRRVSQPRRTHILRMREHISALRQACTAFGETLADIETIAQGLDRSGGRRAPGRST